jgi:hypothetical protein
MKIAFLFFLSLFPFALGMARIFDLSDPKVFEILDQCTDTANAQLNEKNSPVRVLSFLRVAGYESAAARLPYLVENAYAFLKKEKLNTSCKGKNS